MVVNSNASFSLPWKFKERSTGRAFHFAFATVGRADHMTSALFALSLFLFQSDVMSDFLHVQFSNMSCLHASEGTFHFGTTSLLRLPMAE